MTKREVDSKPGKVEAEHSGPPAVTGETDKAPATASDGEGKSGLPTMSAAGAGEWNDTCSCATIMQASELAERSSTVRTKPRQAPSRRPRRDAGDRAG